MLQNKANKTNKNKTSKTSKISKINKTNEANEANEILVTMLKNVNGSITETTEICTSNKSPYLRSSSICWTCKNAGALKCAWVREKKFVWAAATKKTVIASLRRHELYEVYKVLKCQYYVPDEKPVKKIVQKSAQKSVKKPVTKTAAM